MTDQEKLNPQKKEVEIGARTLKTLTLWPLSMTDQLELASIIEVAISKILNETSNDVTFIMAIKNVIADNLINILTKVTDYPTPVRAKKILDDLTNDQFVEICQSIYEMNYEKISKNVVSLLESMSISLTRRPLPMSSNDIQDTALNTSTDFPSGMGDLPSGS